VRLKANSALGAAAIAALFFSTPVTAQEANVAAKAQLCHACHGSDGLSKLPDAPHLAGQPAIYLDRALRAYRSGERRHEVMNVVAKPLSDADIRDLAALYSAIVIEVKPTTR
jgi:cytochrome c553